jgi:hypothetical protein
MPKRAVPLALLLCAAPAAVWSQSPLGPEFVVNSYTTQNQRQPSVAADAAGAFVVVWEGRGPDGDADGIFGQRYDAGGAVEGGEFKVNSYTTVAHGGAAVARHDDGFVVVYQRTFDDLAFSFGVFGRVYDSGGTPQGGEFPVHSYTTGDQGQPSVASDANGNFVVVWESTGQDGSGDGVFAQRHDASGVRQGVEFRVNSFTAGVQAVPSVASDADGNFVVVWQSFGQDGGDYGVFGQRFDALGVAQGGEFAVNAHTTAVQARPAVAQAPDGSFVVVWQSSGQDGDNYGVFGRRFDASGVAQGGEFQVNSQTTGAQREPALALDPSGGFAVTWHGEGRGGAGFDVFGQLYDAAGARLGGEFRVNSYTTGLQQIVSVAPRGAGEFVAAWRSDGQDGSGTAIVGQRFGAVLFADGFESGDVSAWSASMSPPGALWVYPFAAMRSSAFGLSAVVETTEPVFVQDDSPHDETRYRARFYFDTNEFDPGESQDRRRVRLFIAFEENPTRRLAAIVLRRLNGQFSLMGRARRDDDSQHNSGFFPIADGPHVVELDWKRASGPGVSDGSFELWLDGISVHSTTTLDNARSTVDFVRLGALSPKVGTDTALFFDEFVSRRQGYIGP